MTTVTLQTRFAGLLLMVAGWAVLLMAPILLASPALRDVFVIAGLLLELFGLAMVGMYHREEARDRR
ncbi:MAG TPA: hypothetical protein VMU92_12915 [Acidobacteriaceae bacterium]|nr:hypothetical protein [Acidobacteriaceae bacterium]